MKRLIPLICAFLICFISIVPVASAAESSDLIDVLSYGFCNENGSNSQRFGGNTSLTFTYSLPYAMIVQYVDVVFTHTSTVKPSVFFGSRELTVVQISGPLYRAYGSFSAAYISIAELNFNIASASNNRLTIESFHIGRSSLAYSDITGTCLISSADYSATINYVSTDEINYRQFNGPSSPILDDYTLFISSSEWRKFDFLDIVMYLGVDSILSIDATLDGVSIPYTISYFTDSSVDDLSYFFTIRLDLTSLDRSSGSNPTVTVAGDLILSSDNLVSVQDMHGIVYAQMVSSEISWYQKFYLKLIDIYSALSGNSSSGDQFKNDSSGLISDLGDISVSMDSVERPSMDSIDMDFSGDMTDGVLVMSSLFSSVTDVPWMYTLLLASVTLGLVSYILFGKV